VERTEGNKHETVCLKVLSSWRRYQEHARQVWRRYGHI
jgi:hypothetical protein